MAEGHFFSWECFVHGCECCRQKYLEEHVDTLPFSSSEMAEYEDSLTDIQEMSEPIFCPCRYGMSGRCAHCDSRLGSYHEWHSTPQLWSAVFDGYDGAPDSKHPMGFGKTKEEAADDLIEKADACRGDSHD